MSRPPFIAVTGMVGSGKSTLTRALALAIGGEACLEPVGADNPWLSDYLTAPTEEGRRAAWLPLQMHFLMDALATLRRVSDRSAPVVMDQSLPIAWDCFVEGPIREGLVPEASGCVMRAAYEQVSNLSGLATPDLVLALYGPHSLMSARRAQRGRPGEAETPSEYWRALDARYETALKCLTVPVVRVDVRGYDAVRPSGLAPVLGILRRTLTLNPGACRI